MTQQDVPQQSTDPTAPENDPRDIGRLPPLGDGTKRDNWGTVNTFLNQLALKATNFYDDACARADINLEILEKGKCGVIGKRDVIANKIRQDMLTMMAAILRDVPTRKVLPNETGDQPVMVPYLNRQTMSFEQFPVYEQTKADVENKLIDWHWNKAHLDESMWMMKFNARTAGWYTAPFTFDWQAMLPRLWTNISVWQCLLDPAAGPLLAVETANWSFFRWRINWWQARSMFPNMGRLMAQKANEGPERTDPVLQLGKNQQSQITGEKMVDLTFFWHRNFPVEPMTPEEALGYGLIEQRAFAPTGQIPDMGQLQSHSGSVQSADQNQLGALVSPTVGGVGRNQPDTSMGSEPFEPILGEQATDGGNAANDQGLDQGNVGGNSGGSTTNADPFAQFDGSVNGGNPSQDQTSQAPQDQSAGTGFGASASPGQIQTYFLPGDDKPITPADPSWPWWLGIRKLSRVDQSISEDRLENQYDMPFVHMVANPLPMSATGQGDPEAMERIQDGTNRALSNAVEHSELMAHPVKVMCQSAYAALPQSYKEEGASIAGLTVVVSDDIYKDLKGQITVTEDAPVMSATLGEIITLLDNQRQDITPTPNSVQGKQTGDVTGWQTTSMLMQQAVSKFDLPAYFLRLAVERLMRFVRHSVLWFVPIERLQQICREYPPEVVEYIVQDGRTSDEKDIEIIINPTSGGVQDRRKSEAVQMFNLIDDTPGSPTFGQRVIGMKTLRGRMGEDDKMESQLQQMQPQQPEQKPPMEQINFKDLDPQGKVQMAGQAGIQLDINSLMQQQQQDQQAATAKANNNGNGRMAQMGAANG